MSTINELLGQVAKTTVAAAADTAIELEIGSVEKLWDVFRANFRGTDIRPAIREAANPLDMRAVLIAKLETIKERAASLIPQLEVVQEKATALITELESHNETLLPGSDESTDARDGETRLDHQSLSGVRLPPL